MIGIHTEEPSSNAISVLGMVYGWVHDLSTLATGGCFLRDSANQR